MTQTSVRPSDVPRSGSLVYPPFFKLSTIPRNMTDWDDAGSSKATSGFGGGLGRGGLGRGKSEGGFGFGLGRARGRAIVTQTPTFGISNNVRDDSKSTGGGFGSSSGGGFGSSSSSGGGFGGRGGFRGRGGGGFATSNGSTTSEFGSSNGGGGFGSSGGGFGRSEDSDAPKGGGFKSGGGFGGFGSGNRKEGGSGGGSDSGSCYKCGEDGHMARDCPSAGSSSGSRGGGGSRACFKCGEEGHMSRECPSAGGSGGGGSRACYKCGEEGHMSRECPSTGGSSGGGSRACYKCGEEGHMSRECPKGCGGGGGRGGGGNCFKCGESGHFSRECPSAEGSSGERRGFGAGGGGGGGSGKCFKCDQEGHFAKDCPEATEEEKKREPNYIPPPPSEDEEAIFNSMQRGINFDKYDEIPVECSGDDRLERGISTFDEADLSETFRANVRKAKYDRPTPVQKWAIPIIRKGRDLMACAQTGSGKTAAFLLPVLSGMVEKGCGGGGMMSAQSPMALVIGPTRELVVQIHNEARKFSHGSMIRPCVVYGGTSVAHQASQLSRGANLVIGTPGRLADFINRGNISLANVRYLILDEADRMLDMGFGPEVRKIVEQHGMPAKTERQTLMFSATFPEEIQRLAKEFLNNYLFVTVGRVGSANTDIQQSIYEVSQYSKRDKLLEILNESGKDRVLVFVETKRQADFIASFLSQSNFPTTSIHGDRLQREREEALMDFKSGKAPILVATSVAARGLDIPGVKHVVNYDLPSAIDEYVHRIGRTGRCGNLGKASSFFDPDKNADLARSLVKTFEDARQEVPSFLETAAEMGTGTSFIGAGGRFGGRDARQGNFGGGGDDGFGTDDFNGAGGAAEEESWD